MLKLIRTALVLTSFLALAPVSSAQDAPHRHAGRQHHRAARAADRLGLTGAQREQAKALAGQHKQEIRTLHDSVRTARAELQRVIDATPQDSNAVRAAARAVSAAQEDLAVARAARRADVRSVLTPDQQAQVKERDAARAQKRADREQRRAERKARHEEARAHKTKPA